MDPDREHSVLPEAWTWEIVGLNLQRVPSDGSEPYLDLTLRRSGAECRLRFWSPQQLIIQEGGPVLTHGLTIHDISRRGLEGLGVLVYDIEGSTGAVRFGRGPSSVSRDHMVIRILRMHRCEYSRLTFSSTRGGSDFDGCPLVRMKTTRATPIR